MVPESIQQDISDSFERHAPTPGIALEWCCIVWGREWADRWLRPSSLQVNVYNFLSSLVAMSSGSQLNVGAHWVRLREKWNCELQRSSHIGKYLLCISALGGLISCCLLGDMGTAEIKPHERLENNAEGPFRRVEEIGICAIDFGVLLPNESHCVPTRCSWLPPVTSPRRTGRLDSLSAIEPCRLPESHVSIK
jgi:hypothetical protein